MHLGTEKARFKKAAAATWKNIVAISRLERKGDRSPNMFSFGAQIMRIVSELLSGG